MNNLELERGLPASIDAEKTVLGAILLDEDALLQVMAVVVPADFSLDSHQRIILRMAQLKQRGTKVDIVTLSEELRKNDEIEAIGGVAYLASLTEGLPRRPAVDDYLKIVKEKSILRQMMQVCTYALDACSDPGAEALGLIGRLQSEVDDMLRPVVGAEDADVKAFMPKVIEEVMADYLSKAQPTIPSGNPWFDTKSGGGYRRGRYTIVAARPKIGKSSWGVMSTAFNCPRGTWVDWFSLEMDKKELSLNLVPYLVDLPNIVCVRPWLRTPEQQDQVLTALERIEREWPLKIIDGEMDCDKICWTIERRAKAAELDGKEILFILDHFGLIAGGDKDIRKRYVDHSERLRKKIKQFKNAALLCLFQLNEVPREYADKRPQRSDIGESKKPLQDCYAALFLHRYHEKESLRMTTKTNQNLELLRGGGAPGNVDGVFNTRKLLFEADADLGDLVDGGWGQKD